LLDVEILARLIAAGRGTNLPPVEQIVYEYPLKQWHDQKGSKVKPLDFPKALMALVGLWWRYFRPGLPNEMPSTPLAPDVVARGFHDPAREHVMTTSPRAGP
jgi:hypothetical protein